VSTVCFIFLILFNTKFYSFSYPGFYRGVNDKERRKSAGDEDVLKQMNIYVRTRTRP